MRKIWIPLLMAFCIYIPAGYTQQAVEKWLFKHRITALTREIQQGKPIKVIWLGLSGKKTSAGVLMNLSADSLTLDLKGSSVNIPNNRIMEIRTKSKPNFFVNMLAGLMVFLGFIWLVIILVVELFALSSAGEGFPTGKLIVSSILVFLGTLMLIRQMKEAKIIQPFGGDWKMEEQRSAQKTEQP